MEPPLLPGVRENLVATLRRIHGLVTDPLANPGFLSAALARLRFWYLELLELSEQVQAPPVAAGVGQAPPGEKQAPEEPPEKAAAKVPTEEGANKENPHQTEKKKSTSQAKKSKQKDKKAKEKKHKKRSKSESRKEELRSQTPVVTPALEKPELLQVKEEVADFSGEEDADTVQSEEKEDKPVASSPKKDKSPAPRRHRRSRSSRRGSTRSGRHTPAERSESPRKRHRLRSAEPRLRSRSPRRSRRRSVSPRSSGTRRGSGSLRPAEPNDPPPGCFREPSDFRYRWHPYSQGEVRKGKNRGVKNRARNEDIYLYGCSAQRKADRVGRAPGDPSR